MVPRSAWPNALIAAVNRQTATNSVTRECIRDTSEAMA
jgi:hypothetical protein